MNKYLFDQMLNSYVVDFDSNWKEEDYKWIEVKRFQERFNLNCNSSDFASMLKDAVDVSSNLIAGQNYYPIAEIIKLAETYPVEVQKAFVILFDEERELSERVSEYIDIIKDIKQKTGTESIKDGCDDRFISTMLYYKFPEEYSIYKYREDKEFCEKFELGFNVKMGDSSNIALINDLTKSIVEYLIDENHEVLNLYRKKLESNDYYHDESGLMLAQNIIWYAIKYEPSRVKVNSPLTQIKIKHGNLTQSHYKPVILEKGKTTDYEKAQKEKAKIGLLGEEYVIQYENERLLKMGKKAELVSKTKGDGLGYDILSYNDDGSKRYIEVKSTNSSEKTTFYITATELAACKKYGDAYYLYRLYKENGKWQISYYQGKEVEALCNCPYQYAVAPESQK